MTTIVISVLLGAISGIGASIVLAFSQRKKVKAEVELTAAETAAVVLKELRAEREDLRQQIDLLILKQAQDHEENQRAIEELKAAESRCLRRLERAIQAMRENGIDIPPDLFEAA